METVTRSPQTNGHPAYVTQPVQVQRDDAPAVRRAILLDGVKYGPPEDGVHDPAAWADLVEALHNTNELSRLARGLAA